MNESAEKSNGMGGQEERRALREMQCSGRGKKRGLGKTETG